MFALFRRKPKGARPRGRPLKESAPPKIESGASDRPTFEGYTIQEVESSQLDSAGLTPEELNRWVRALTEKNT